MRVIARVILPNGPLNPNAYFRVCPTAVLSLGENGPRFLGGVASFFMVKSRRAPELYDPEKFIAKRTVIASAHGVLAGFRGKANIAVKGRNLRC
jgi:hypothetical protein